MSLYSRYWLEKMCCSQSEFSLKESPRKWCESLRLEEDSLYSPSLCPPHSQRQPCSLLPADVITEAFRQKIHWHWYDQINTDTDTFIDIYFINSTLGKFTCHSSTRVRKKWIRNLLENKKIEKHGKIRYKKKNIYTHMYNFLKSQRAIASVGQPHLPSVDCML